MNDEKDRLGQKLREAERAREDQYFAKRDHELLEKMRAGQEPASEANVMQVARGRCPRCGLELNHRVVRGVGVDECTKCGGVWLDKGELEAIAKGENEGWIARWLRNEFSQTE